MIMLLAIGVRAQGQEGPLATLGLSLGGEYRANDPDEDESRLTAGLDFALSSVTRSRSFLLAADGEFVFDENGSDFERPGLLVNYARENRSTAFDAGLSYSIRDVDGVVDVIDPITLNVIDFVDDDGTLESVQINAGLVTGRQARFGTDTQVSFTDRTYSGTSDADLTDLQSWQIGTTLSFDVSPLVDLVGTASYRETEEEDEQSTEDRTIRLGINSVFRIDPLWTAEAGLSYSRFETESDGPSGDRVLEEEDGTGFSLTVTRLFRDGSLGVSYSRDATEIGTEDALSIFGGKVLANGSELDWSLGLVALPGGEMRPIASASYALPTPRGGLSVNIQQTALVNNDDESIVSTSLGVNWGQEINAVSSWSINGALSSVDVVSDDGEDQARAEVGLTYSRALTRDWDLATGLRHRVTYSDGERDDSASILSLSLERSFSFRP